jgi:RNase H-like domain found in reverse transcriptase
MFPKRSHILAPLTAMVGGKGPLKWTDECQHMFAQMKATMAHDAFLRYPDHNKPFHIYCDAIDLQLGAVITQEGAPVAFYSCKLNRAQHNYTIGEKEILSIVETLKEYHTMLYGCPHLYVYTDHKNNTLIVSKPNAYYAGSCSLRTMWLNSITSKVNPIHLLTHFPVFPLMRGRTLQIATITQAFSMMLQAKHKKHKNSSHLHH